MNKRTTKALSFLATITGLAAIGALGTHSLAQWAEATTNEMCLGILMANLKAN
jgi:uncharacterized membrane protein YebE (DUF533 family)